MGAGVKAANPTLQWTGPASRAPVKLKSVGAVPAIERRSVMRLQQSAKFTRRHIGRLVRFALIVGIVPLLVTGCYRSMHVIDHLDIDSGSSIFPSLRLGSGDGHLFCSAS